MYSLSIIKRKLINRLNYFRYKYFTLENFGERVDINYFNNIDFAKLNIYQKSHISRYNFAVDFIKPEFICGDFACGSGYGSIILSKKCKEVIGIDIEHKVIKRIKKRYKNFRNVTFLNSNLLDLKFSSNLDCIISFETIEHFPEDKINLLLQIFNEALKPGGWLIFSTPFMQKEDDGAKKLGFHLTFNINVKKINNWLTTNNFKPMNFYYQNYDSHKIVNELDKKDFIICVAKKNDS